MGHYLLTGCAGFIGSRVAELLLAEGHHLVGVDNLNDSYDPRLKHWRLDQTLRHRNFQFLELDVADEEALAAEVSAENRFDAIINLAARAGVRQSVAEPAVYFETNLLGTLNLLEMARSRGIPKFILASTSSVYGSQQEMPYREDQNTECPLSPYAASKKAAEVLCHTYHHLHGIDVTIFRYFTVYGPAGRPDMSVFRFTQWIAEGRPVYVFGDGRQSRDFTYVDDIARGTIAGLQSVGYGIFNLGSDSPVALSELIRTIEEILDRKAELRFQPLHAADVRATWADVSKARHQLGWTPAFGFREGVELFVQWYRENQDWASQISTGAL